MSKNYKILTAKTGNVEMDYLVFGNGSRPFVILPGLSVTSVLASAEAVCAAYADFADRYTVYLFDRAENFGSDYDIYRMADDTAAVMKSLGIRGADVFGASQGGMMALTIAVNYPDLVRKVIVGSALAKHNDTLDACMTKWKNFALAKDRRSLNRSIYGAMFTAGFVSRNLDAIASLDGIGSDEDLEKFAVLADAAKNFDIYEKLPEIRCPVLVIGAENDEVLTGAASRAIAEKLGCEIYMYEGYGHAVYDEAPDYRNRMLEFFSK